MKKCLIFCAAEFDRLAEAVEGGDYILAADGGLRHLNKLNITPHGIIGDFDSLGYVPEGAQVFPVEKDDTDAMLAARKGLELGFREFRFYGALDGPRHQRGDGGISGGGGGYSVPFLPRPRRGGRHAEKSPLPLGKRPAHQRFPPWCQQPFCWKKRQDHRKKGKSAGSLGSEKRIP